MQQADQAFLDRYVLPHLPDRIFDAHAHLFAHAHFPGDPQPEWLAAYPPVVDIGVYRQWMEALHPVGRTVGGVFFGMAFQADRDANNTFVAQETAQARAEGFAAFGQMLIAPEMPAEMVRAAVQEQGFVGLKPYHLMATGTDGPTFDAPIEAYLPEEHVAVAHELGLSITLHMVRARALADPVNQATIRRYCLAYPNMRLVLAHAARGFNPWHTIEGIDALKGLDNVWCDTSAVTEAGAFEAIVDTLGHERLLYGTDFHVSHMRGRCVAVGDSFHWLYADGMNLDEKHTQLQPVLVGLESLRSLFLAIHRLRLTPRQIDDIFYHNARGLWPDLG